MCTKPLNPRAKSWFPDAKKPSEDFTQAQKPFRLPREIYGTVPAHFASAVLYEPFLQPPAVAVFQAPHEASLYYVIIQHECLPFGCVSSYPIYPDQQANGGFLMEKKDDEVKGVRMKKLSEDSNSLKEILRIPRSRPKILRKVVPPRLRREYFEKFQQRKRLLPSREVWKPKNPEHCVAAPETLPLASLEEEPPVCEKTTVMLKNIPNQYRRDSLMAFLNEKCCELHLAYDFLYLPMDFIKGNNLGFAFVNLTTPTAAMKIKTALEGYKWGEFYLPNGKFTSRKILEITWAKIQGKDALIRHFEKSHFTCDNIQYLPVVIFPPSDGSSISSLITIGQLHGGFCKSSKRTKPAL